MGTLNELLKQRPGTPLRPPRVVTIPPSAWASHRADRPAEPVQVGLRLISEEDTQYARGEAARIAAEYIQNAENEEERVAAFNDALIRVALGRALCQPHDVTQPYFLMGEDEIRVRLTSDGARRLYQELEALHVAESPAMPEIDEEGFAHLLAMWDRGLWLKYTDRAERMRILRLLEACRQEMLEAEMLGEAAGEALVAG